MIDRAFNGGFTGGFLSTSKGGGGVIPPVDNWEYSFRRAAMDAISANIPYIIGDELIIRVKDRVADGTTQIIVTATPNILGAAINSAGFLTYNEASSDMYLDGVLLVSGVTPYPLDGESHAINLIFKVAGAITTLFANAGLFNTFSMTAEFVRLNTGVEYNYLIDDGYANDPVIANSGTGADAVMVNGLESSWSVVTTLEQYNFTRAQNGGVSVDFPFVIGDEITIDIIKSAVPSGFIEMILHRADGKFVQVNAAGLIRFSAPEMDVYLDNVLLVSTMTPYPTDGIPHVLKVVAKTSSNVTTLFSSNTGFTNSAEFIGKNVKLNDGSAYFYKIDDGYATDPVIKNYGSGADGTMVNGIEASWSVI